MRLQLNTTTLVYVLFCITVLSITFEREVYTVVENEGSVEVCFLTNTGHMDRTKVEIELISLVKGTGHSTPSKHFDLNLSANSWPVPWS